MIGQFTRHDLSFTDHETKPNLENESYKKKKMKSPEMSVPLFYKLFKDFLTRGFSIANLHLINCLITYPRDSAVSRHNALQCS